MRETSEADVSELGELLGVAFSARERANAADRLDTLTDILKRLEAVPTYGLRDQDELAETPRAATAPRGSARRLARAVRSRSPGQRGVAVGPRRRDQGQHNTCVRGVEMICGSRALEGFATVEHAEVVERVLDQGGQIVGKTALEQSRLGWWGIAPAEFAAMFLTNGIGLWRTGPQERGFPSALSRLRSASSGTLGSNIKEMLALGARLLVDEGGAHYVPTAVVPIGSIEQHGPHPHSASTAMRESVLRKD